MFLFRPAKPAQKRVPTAPESVLKRRKRKENVAKRAIVKNLKAKKARKLKRREIFKRAEKYVVEYKRQRKVQQRLAKIAKKDGNYYVPDQPKLALVIRTKGLVECIQPLRLFYFFCLL